MLKRILSMFEGQIAGAGSAEREHTLEFAAAALLLEVSHADHERHADEEAVVMRAIRETYDLSEEEVGLLLASAADSVAESVSMYEFTRIVNEQLSAADKCTLIEDLWRVAYADGRIDKYEEYSIRKIAELLYVPHSEFIRAKLSAARRADRARNQPGADDGMT